MPLSSPRRRRSAMMKSGMRPLMLRERFVRIHGGDAFAAPAFQQALHAEAHRFFIVDHDDELAADQIRHFVLDGDRRRLDFRRIGERHFDREPRALARHGAQMQRMIEQLCDTAHSREAETQAAACDRARDC